MIPKDTAIFNRFLDDYFTKKIYLSKIFAINQVILMDYNILKSVIFILKTPTMKRFLLLFFAFTLLISITSCHRKAHCPAYDNVHTKTDKQGQFKKSKTKSNLFPKKMRKKKR
jgi:hypothetical protein